MQDEVAKHTKKLYKAATKPGHFIEKIKEVAIEIFIIVFAVTLSIWLHSWSDHRHEQKEVNEFLKGLKEDLSKDIDMLNHKKKDVAAMDSGFYYVSTLAGSPALDTIGEKTISERLYFNISLIRPGIGRYEGFKSSGKMESIENDSLKQGLLVYYQQTIPDLLMAKTLSTRFS